MGADIGHKVKHNADKIAIIIMAITFILNIISMSAKGWFKETFTILTINYTANFGLFKYKVCGAGICDTYSISEEIDDSSTTAAGYITLALLLVALVVALIYFVLAIFNTLGRSIGKFGRPQMAKATLVSAVIVLVCYMIAIILYPILFDGSPAQSSILNYKQHYSYSYYFTITNVFLASIAVSLLIFHTVSQRQKMEHTPI